MTNGKTLNTISRMMQAAAILALVIVAVYALVMLLLGRTIPHQAPVLYPLAFHPTAHLNLAALLFLLLLGLVGGFFAVTLIAGARQADDFNPQIGRRALQIGAAATLLVIAAAFVRTVQIGADVAWQHVASVQGAEQTYRLLDYTSADPAQPSPRLLRLFQCDPVTGLFCEQVYSHPAGELPPLDETTHLLLTDEGHVTVLVGAATIFTFPPNDMPVN